MKQTILSKCFSKMKRFALTLFAALCAGSVWAGYLTFEAQDFAVSEDGTITFNAKLGYHGTETDRYAQLTAVGYNANGEVAFQETKVIGEELTELKLEEEGEGDGYVTHSCTIPNSGLSATENYKVKFHFWAVKADGSLSADYDITRYVFPPIGVTGITAKYGDLLFRIFGNIESGYNISAIKVNYILGTGTPNLVADATIDAEAGTFLCEIPYTPTEYTLTYKITVEYADGTSKVYLDDINGTDTQVKTRLTADNTKVIYTWTGEGDGTSWTDELNWTVNSDVDTVGYPGTHDGSYYRTMFTISEDVECIDLKGGTYGFVDDGAMYIAPNKTVKFKNGKFRFTSSEISRTTADASGASDELIGSNGGTLIFEKVYLRSCKDNGTESGNLAIVPRSGATIVFEGTYSDNWDYYPKSANTGTKIIIRDGELTLSRNLNGSANGSQNDVLISNAKWNVTKNDSRTITPFKSLTFRDGPNRQAQFVHTGDLKLTGTYDFALPATPYSTPYYKLRKLSANAAGTIKVDVTNYKGGGLVPLVAFSGTLDDNTKNSMKTITTTASKLVVTANGEDVKTARNAKLVWNESKKTLYFQQDPVNAAEVAGVEYATFAEAFDAAQAGETVKLLKNTATAGFKIQKSVTLDLNGNTLTLTPPAVGSTGTETLGIQILAAAENVTIKNGTINVAESNLTAEKPIKMMINNYTNLALVNATLDGTNLVKPASSPIYVLSNNRGTVALTGETSIVAPEDAVAFDVCKYSTYTPPTVTLNTTGTISGKVEVSGGAFVIGAENTATLSAIDFTAGSVKGAVESILTIPEDKKLVETDGVYTLTDKDVLAKVGDKLFETIAEAFAAAQAGDAVLLMKDFAVETVLAIPEGVTLDLNGNELQALAVVGKLSMNGGALKTYDTNTQTFFFMAAPAETAGALYWTSDAVMTIGADYTLSLDGGSVTLPASWRSLLKQTLTIKSGASFVIPTGVELNLRGNAVVESGATLTCDGTIALGNTYDAIDTSATLTSAQLAEGKVTSKVEGYRVVYANGVYSLEVKAWTAPLPEKDGEAPITEEYTFDVLAALDAAVATSVDVKVNGVELKGNEAVKALNTAVASFDNAITFDGTAAILDIEIKVTEVNTEDPAASTVVVKRGAEELTVKVTPTVKYFYPETKTWGSDKPESGAVLFKLVF